MATIANQLWTEHLPWNGVERTSGQGLRGHNHKEPKFFFTSFPLPVLPSLLFLLSLSTCVKKVSDTLAQSFSSSPSCTSPQSHGSQSNVRVNCCQWLGEEVKGQLKRENEDLKKPGGEMTGRKAVTNPPES